MPGEQEALLQDVIQADVLDAVLDDDYLNGRTTPQFGVLEAMPDSHADHSEFDRHAVTMLSYPSK